MRKTLLFFAIISSSLSPGEDTVEIQILKGKEIVRHIDDFAALRISYFRQYPYFYQVNLSAEKEYLTTYVSSPDTIFVVAGKKAVGILTGCPLTESIESYQRPFMNKKLPLDEVFCLGEFVFEDGYENEVLQRKMYNQLEALIREDEKYKQIIVYELVRLENDFAPPGYVSTEEFWEKMGFAKQEDLSYSIPWEDSRTNQQINHTLVGWTKYIE